jgi:hypothetical protein
LRKEMGVRVDPHLRFLRRMRERVLLLPFRAHEH